MGKITRNFTIKNTDVDKYNIYCRECCGLTLHSIISSYEESGVEDCGRGNSIDWDCKNQTIQCCGCQTVSFRTVSTFSEDVEYENDGPYYPKTIKYYPGRVEGVKSLDSYLLPHTIRQIYKETVMSLENEQFVLAGIGIRAIVETICKDLNAEGGNLNQKINAIKERSIITEEGAQTLHKLRVLGNNAAHEVKAHNSMQLELALKIIEHMLEGTYIIPKRVQAAFPENG